MAQESRKDLGCLRGGAGELVGFRLSVEGEEGRVGVMDGSEGCEGGRTLPPRLADWEEDGSC